MLLTTVYLSLRAPVGVRGQGALLRYHVKVGATVFYASLVEPPDHRDVRKAQARLKALTHKGECVVT